MTLQRLSQLFSAFLAAWNGSEFVYVTIYNAVLNVSSQVAGGAVSDVEPHSVGLNPAWRTAISNIVFSQSWAEGATSEEINVIRAENQAALDRFEALDPAAGTYFNEARC